MISVDQLFGRDDELSMQSCTLAGANKGHIHVHDFKKLGVLLVNPGHPDFETTLEIAIGSKTTEFIQLLKEISVVLHNKSPKRIIGYSLNWNYRSLSRGVVHDHPGALVDPGRPGHCPGLDDSCSVCIDPGSAVLISPLIRISKTTAQTREGWLNENIEEIRCAMNDSTDIKVVLDGVMFEDGSFAGGNANKLFESVVASFDAVQDFYRRFLGNAEQTEQPPWDLISCRLRQQPATASNATTSPVSDQVVSELADYNRNLAMACLTKVQRCGGLRDAITFARSRLFKERPSFKNLHIAASR
jgi:hypothetical protein